MSDQCEAEGLAVPCREKYWEELTIDQKIEKLAYCFEQQHNQISRVEQRAHEQSVVKIVDGKEYIPRHGVSLAQLDIRWLLNRKPRD